MKRKVNVFDYSKEILEALQDGILLTTKSEDKINELGLTLTNPDIINTPGVKELPLTLECKVIYKQEQDRNEIKEEFVKEFYPKNVDGSFSGANKDFHSNYYGEIVSAYIEE